LPVLAGKYNGDWALRFVPKERLHHKSDNASGVRGAPSDDQDAGSPGVAAGDVDILPTIVSDEHCNAELDVCAVLRGWSPWALPSAELVGAVQRAAKCETGVPTCRMVEARQHVVKQLALEETAMQYLPEQLQYRRTARWYLKKALARGALPVAGLRKAAMIDSLHATVSVDEAKVVEACASNCSRGACRHTCMDPFRDNPNVIRNWRVLWRSLPAAGRRESLLCMFRVQLEQHMGAGGVKEDFQMKHYPLLGQKVCLEAFAALTGIGRWSVTQARTNAFKGHKSSLSRGELPMELAMRPTNKPQMYLEARAWLEVYAKSHEASPMAYEAHLPGGRKVFYFELMSYERRCQGKESCALTTFLEMWRVELPWVKICISVCKFVQCGVCEYLKMQIDLCPRADAVLMNAYRNRLGRHFKFQSSQRLGEGRCEEACVQSGGDQWFMHLDKMDQTRTIIPTIWSQLSTPFFKGGERIVAGIIGAYCAGINNTEIIVRTVFQDCQHGSNMQASAALLNFHNAALREGFLPQKLHIGADNTPKETKNQWFLWFVVWLLCVLVDTNFWYLEDWFLIVGHTHGKLDRFFSRLVTVLAGKNYLTLDDMFKIICAELKGFRIECEHLHTVWDFKPLVSDMTLPAVHGLHHVHGIKIYRSNGVWIQWRQYISTSQMRVTVSLSCLFHLTRSAFSQLGDLSHCQWNFRTLVRCALGSISSRLCWLMPIILCRDLDLLHAGCERLLPTRPRGRQARRSIKSWTTLCGWARRGQLFRIRLVTFWTCRRIQLFSFFLGLTCPIFLSMAW